MAPLLQKPQKSRWTRWKSYAPWSVRSGKHWLTRIQNGDGYGPFSRWRPCCCPQRLPATLIHSGPTRGWLLRSSRRLPQALRGPTRLLRTCLRWSRSATRCDSMKKCACGWRSWKHRTGSPVVNHCQRMCDGCLGTSSSLRPRPKVSSTSTRRLGWNALVWMR